MKLLCVDESNAKYLLVAALGEGFLLTAIITIKDGVIFKELA